MGITDRRGLMMIIHGIYIYIYHMAVSIFDGAWCMVLFVAEKSPQNAPSTREVSVFLTDPPKKSVEISGLKNFHICTGGVFFNIILTDVRKKT